MTKIEKAAKETGKVRLPEFSPMEWIEKRDGRWFWCHDHCANRQEDEHTVEGDALNWEWQPYYEPTDNN